MRIGIRSRQQSYAAARHALQRAEKGGSGGREAGLYFESVDELRRMLTSRRLDLLAAVLHYRPGSVTDLARLVRRDLKNVSDDLALLHQLGLVELTPGAGHGNARAPVVPYDEIDLTIDLRAFSKRKVA